MPLRDSDQKMFRCVMLEGDNSQCYFFLFVIIISFEGLVVQLCFTSHGQADANFPLKKSPKILTKQLSIIMDIWVYYMMEMWWSLDATETQYLSIGYSPLECWTWLLDDYLHQQQSTCTTPILTIFRLNDKMEKKKKRRRRRYLSISGPNHCCAVLSSLSLDVLFIPRQ